MRETWVRSLGREDPLKKAMADPPQYSCLENSTDRGAWQATVHGGHKESDMTEQLTLSQNWPQDWKRSVFIPIPNKGNAKQCSNYCIVALISHANKGMLKILQARLK